MSKTQRINPVLKIDPEFENRIPPLTDEEFQQLEQNIVSEGMILMPLVVWDSTIIDGHNRYKIAQAHPEIIFTVHEKDFENRCEALAWICNNQLGRRNLTPIQKRLLIGDRYEAEKMAHGGDRKSSEVKSTGQNGQLVLSNDAVTRQRIADETGTNDSYVKRAGQFSQGATAAEEVSPGFRQEVLSGNIKPAQKEMQAVARGSPEERKSIIDQVFRRGRKSPNMARGKSRKWLPDVTLNTTADEDEHTVTVESAVKQFEWEVTKVMQDFDITFNQTRGLNRIGCIATAYAEFPAVGAEIYTEALRVIVAAWSGHKDSLRAETIQGVTEFIKLYHNEYDPKRLVSRCHRCDPMHIYRRAKAAGDSLPAPQKYILEVWNIYNGTGKLNNLPLRF